MIGFAREQVHTRGRVDLLTTFGSRKLSKSLTIPYILVDTYTLYNILLDRPNLNVLRAIVSTPHLAMKFPPPPSYGEYIIVKAAQEDARECYVKSYRIQLYNMVKEDNNR